MRVRIALCPYCDGLSSHTGHGAGRLGVTSAARRVRYGSFGTGFEVFPFLIVAINHPTTPPPT